jgi:hypothetical protein
MNSKPHRFITLCIILSLLFSISPTNTNIVHAANARIRPWQAIRWAALNLTPAGKVAKPFIDRQNAYRTADRWMAEKRSSLSQRQEKLATMYRSREIDSHTYIKYKTLIMMMDNQYKETQSSMKGIAHDKFGKDFMQVFVDQIAPRLLSSGRFTATMREVNETFTTTQKVMKDGLNALEELKSKMYPEFMRNGREKLEEVIKKMDERGIRGGIADDLYGKLQQVVGELKRLEKDVPEALTPKEIKQMSAEVNDAVEQLGKIQKQMNDEVNQWKEQGTIRIPVGGKGKAAELSSQLQAIRDMEKLTELEKVLETAELYEEFGSGIAQKLAELGLEPTDGNYGKIRAELIEALIKVDPKNRTEEKMAELFRKIASEVMGKPDDGKTESNDESGKEPAEVTETPVKYTRARLTADMSVETFSKNFGISWADFSDLVGPNHPLCARRYAVTANLESILFEVDVDLVENVAIIKVNGNSSCNQDQCYSGEYGTGSTNCSFSGTLQTTDVRFEPEFMNIFVNADGFVDVTCLATDFCGYDPSLKKPIWYTGQASSKNQVNFFVARDTQYEDCIDELSLWTNLDETQDRIFMSVGNRYLDSEQCFPLSWTFE